MYKKITIKHVAWVFILIQILNLTGCRACRRGEGDPEVTVSSGPIVLQMKDEVSQEGIWEEDPKVKRIEIGPSKRQIKEEPPPAEVAEKVAEKEAEPKTTDLALPPDTHEETDLTARLREKMLDAYAGKEEALPDVKIYLSDMGYDEFISYYKNLGYKTNTVAVPAKEVIGPVLEQRPELVGKINLADYEDIIIHQVMVDDAGISAADKYIDPDTFEVINKTFVTKMNK